MEMLAVLLSIQSAINFVGYVLIAIGVVIAAHTLVYLVECLMKGRKRED